MISYRRNAATGLVERPKSRFWLSADRPFLAEGVGGRDERCGANCFTSIDTRRYASLHNLLEVTLIDEAVVESSQSNSNAVFKNDLNEVDLEVFFSRKGTICQYQNDKFDDTVAFAGWVMLDDMAYLTAAATAHGGVVVQSVSQALPFENCLNLKESDKSQLASMQHDWFAEFCRAIKSAT